MNSNNNFHYPQKNMVCSYNFEHLLFKCKSQECIHSKFHYKDDECKVICPNSCVCINVDKHKQKSITKFIVNDFLFLRPCFLVVLGLLNFFIFQFFCIRIAVKFRNSSSKQVSSVILLKWVIPLTGWKLPILKYFSNGQVNYKSSKTLIYISSELEMRYSEKEVFI